MAFNTANSAKIMSDNSMLLYVKVYYLEQHSGGGRAWVARILVVDDEPDERFLVGRTLRKQGHHVTVAENGAAGLKAVQQGGPDLVVTDIMMPVMNGVELLEKARNRR